MPTITNIHMEWYFWSTLGKPALVHKVNEVDIHDAHKLVRVLPCIALGYEIAEVLDKKHCGDTTFADIKKVVLFFSRGMRVPYRASFADTGWELVGYDSIMRAPIPGTTVALIGQFPDQLRVKTDTPAVMKLLNK